MSLVSDIVENVANNNIAIAYQMVTTAHLKAMLFVLQGKVEMSPTTTMVIYEHEFLNEFKNEIESLPEHLQGSFKECFEKYLQPQLDRNLLGKINND